MEQLQNEKRKALLEHETSKLRDCDYAIQKDLREWKDKLLPRKQVRSFYIILFFIKTKKKPNMFD